LHEQLFVEGADPWRAIPTAAAVAAAAFAVGLRAFDWERPLLRTGVLTLGVVSSVYAASLGVVSLPASWAWGHVGVAALGGAVAVALSWARLRFAGGIAAGGTGGRGVGADLSRLASPARRRSLGPAAAATRGGVPRP